MKNKQILGVLIGILLIVGTVSAYTSQRIQIRTQGYIEQDFGKVRINADFRERGNNLKFHPILGKLNLRAVNPNEGKSLEIKTLNVIDGTFEEGKIQLNTEAKIVAKRRGEKTIVYNREPMEITIDKKNNELKVEFKDDTVYFDVTGNWR